MRLYPVKSGAPVKKSGGVNKKLLTFIKKHFGVWQEAQRFYFSRIFKNSC